jgi:hypothetical protein
MAGQFAYLFIFSLWEKVHSTTTMVVRSHTHMLHFTQDVREIYESCSIQCVCVESLPRLIGVSEEYSTRETYAFCRRSAFFRCSNTIRLRIRFLWEKAYLFSQHGSLNHGWNWSEDKAKSRISSRQGICRFINRATSRVFFPFYFIDLVRLPAHLNLFKLHPNACTMVPHALVAKGHNSKSAKTTERLPFFQLTTLWM